MSRVLNGRPLSSKSRLFLFYVGFALLLTYPLLFQLSTHIPQGSEGVGTVPFFNLWTLQWNIKQLTLGYPNYWDAPIFAPQPGTFTFSESQPLSALLAAPVWLAFQSPALAYNGLVLLFLTLNGWFAYWLMRGWTVALWPAFFTGLLVQALPFVTQEMGVLQLLAIFGFLWSLLFLERLLGSRSNAVQPRWRRSIGLALGTPITFFTCSTYGLLSIFFLPTSFLLTWRRHHLTGKMMGHIIVIGLLILLLSGPLLLTQQQRLSELGFTRSAEVIKNNSAKLGGLPQLLRVQPALWSNLGVVIGVRSTALSRGGDDSLSRFGIGGAKSRAGKNVSRAGYNFCLTAVGRATV